MLLGTILPIDMVVGEHLLVQIASVDEEAVVLVLDDEAVSFCEFLLVQGSDSNTDLDVVVLGRRVAG